MTARAPHLLRPPGSRGLPLPGYSGAFPAGLVPKADTAVHTLERFQGRGRAVLTASDATQYSFEGNQRHGEAPQSVFTRHLVAGLRDGSADLDGDGDITIDELYSYVHDHVVDEMPRQRPKKQDNVEGRIVIARNVNWSLPSFLRHALSSPIAAERLAGLDGLANLYRMGNEMVRQHVAGELQRLTDDDSRAVSAAAAAHLSALLPRQAPGEAEPPSLVLAAEPAQAQAPGAQSAQEQVMAAEPAQEHFQAAEQAQEHAPAAEQAQKHAPTAEPAEEAPRRLPPPEGAAQAAEPAEEQAIVAELAQEHASAAGTEHEHKAVPGPARERMPEPGPSPRQAAASRAAAVGAAAEPAAAQEPGGRARVEDGAAVLLVGLGALGPALVAWARAQLRRVTLVPPPGPSLRRLPR